MGSVFVVVMYRETDLFRSDVAEVGDLLFDASVNWVFRTANDDVGRQTEAS